MTTADTGTSRRDGCGGRDTGDRCNTGTVCRRCFCRQCRRRRRRQTPTSPMTFSNRYRYLARAFTGTTVLARGLPVATQPPRSCRYVHRVPDAVRVLTGRRRGVRADGPAARSATAAPIYIRRCCRAHALSDRRPSGWFNVRRVTSDIGRDRPEVTRVYSRGHIQVRN